LKTGESLRWLLAVTGPILLETASFVFFFGGAARGRYECRVSPEQCPIDYIPVLEIVLPFITLALLYPFARLSFSLFSPDPEQRTLRWRLATKSSKEDLFPLLPGFAAMGIAWTVWRGLSYPALAEFVIYRSFWFTFALWFAVGAAIAFPWKKR